MTQDSLKEIVRASKENYCGPQLMTRYLTRDVHFSLHMCIGRLRTVADFHQSSTSSMTLKPTLHEDHSHCHGKDGQYTEIN